MKSLKYKLKESHIAAKEQNTEKLKEHRHNLSCYCALCCCLKQVNPLQSNG